MDVITEQVIRNQYLILKKYLLDYICQIKCLNHDVLEKKL